MSRLQVGGYAELQGGLVRIVDFRSAPVLPNEKGAGVAHVPGATVTWLAESSNSFTHGSSYLRPLHDLRPMPPPMYLDIENQRLAKECEQWRKAHADVHLHYQELMTTANQKLRAENAELRERNDRLLPNNSGEVARLKAENDKLRNVILGVRSVTHGFGL